ncbi:MAG: heat-inducible transcriptional repressor HrcA [Firmicutes bacterium]|nr:heat-inducible transcriptional repressor HrcA [Bacillota bacterium]
MLDARKKAILFVAVQEYILTAEPVSSHRLVEKYQLGVSSATVRNELAVLEDLGYLHQPHTSAGRIPTDIAYRFYVDSTADKPGLTLKEEKAIVKLYSALNKEMEELLRETTSILSKLTNYIAVVMAPTFKSSRLKHIDLVSLSPKHMLMVLITDKGQVLKRTISVETHGVDVSGVEHLLNERLQGLQPSEISTVKDAIDLSDYKSAGFIHQLIDEIVDVMQSEDKERVFLGGTTSILGQPEFEDFRKVQSLLSSLEHGYRLLQWLEDSYRSDKVFVRIGSENADQQIKDCSVIASTYHVDDEAFGTLGIIGPTRMNYARAISAVEFIAGNLTKALNDLRS